METMIEHEVRIRKELEAAGVELRSPVMLLAIVGGDGGTMYSTGCIWRGCLGPAMARAPETLSVLLSRSL